MLLQELKLNSSVKILWKSYNSSGHRVPPIGRPKCGFEGCPPPRDIFKTTEFVISVIFTIIMLLILSWFGFR